MADTTIILGNKTYSSWSLRGWLLLKLSGADFDEIVIPLDRPETKAELERHTPAGRVPVLYADGLTVWDSLAIAEFLHERFPQAGLWPADPEARAVARSVSAEMHAGFAALRRLMPMDLRRPPRPAQAPGQTPGPDSELGADIARIQEIWHDCRERFGAGGNFLFGQPCAADAFFAPVASRFVTYGVPLEPVAAGYRDAIMSWPVLREWIAAAKEEPWVIENP